jgi:catechol 2,3-dioxygenase-like lactoylglutathione lyase family enzyme
VKTHLSLGTTDLAKSVDFYSTLLDTGPTKRLDDYVLFVTETPGLELALHPAKSLSPQHGAHYGICVDSVGEVESAIARLDRSGLVSSIEREETCCYANQTKVWAIDPEGRRWEVYAVHEDTDERESATTCCSGG